MSKLGNIRNIALLLIAMALATLATGCGAASPSVESQTPPSITVSGIGEARGVPDMATIQLGISALDSDVGKAVREVNEITEAVKASVVAKGVAALDVQTTNYSVWPEERYDPERGFPTGERIFHVDSMMQVIVRDVDRMGDIISAGLEAGANNIYGIVFGVQETELLSADARTQALADAQERASQLASGLGLKLGEPITITEGMSEAVSIPTTREAALGIGGGGGAPISPGETIVRVQVTVAYALLP